VVGIRRASSVWAEQEARCRANGLTVTVVEVVGARQLREAVEWWSMRGWQPERQVPTGGLLFGVDLGRIAWTFRRVPDSDGDSPAVHDPPSRG
jgi:hypothetical protein